MGHFHSWLLWLKPTPGVTGVTEATGVTHTGVSSWDLNMNGLRVTDMLFHKPNLLKNERNVKLKPQSSAQPTQHPPYLLHPFPTILEPPLQPFFLLFPIVPP